MTKEMEKERANLRKALNETESELTIEGAKNAPKKAPDKLQIGDIVMVHSMGIKGTVSTLPNSKGKCFVQMGILRSEVSVSDLELLEQETKAASIHYPCKKYENGKGYDYFTGNQFNRKNGGRSPWTA